MLAVENDCRLEQKRDVLSIFVNHMYWINVNVWPILLYLPDIVLLSGDKLGRLSIFFFFWTILMTFSSTLVIGGAGSIMLELYGWESVFYISGILAVLWAYCMWKFMLKGEGNCSIISRKTCVIDSLAGLVWACAPLTSCFAFLVPNFKQLAPPTHAWFLRG